MKIINFFKITLFISLITFSCSDFTEIEPKDELAANLAFQRLEDFEQGVAGAYSALRGAYGTNYSILPDILADNLKVTAEHRGFFLQERDWFNSEGDDAGMWVQMYSMLNRINTMTALIDEFKDSNEQKYNRILAQMLTLRALGHFDLLRYYGVSYDRNDETERGGIVVVTNVVTPEGQPARNTVKETYDQIYADLEAAEILYGDIDQDINEGPGERHFLDLIAMKALRARISFYAQDWNDAITYATDVLGDIPLANATDFATMWTDDTFGGENIMSIPFSAAEGASGVSGLLWNPSNSADPTGAGQSQFTLSDDLVANYTTTDARFAWVANAPVGKNYSFIQRKYPDDGVGIFSDIKMFRAGEMQLIIAEAYLNLGDNNNARTFLNALRIARDPSIVIAPGTPSDGVLGLVLELERRKELVIEGHRWFDLRRTGGSINRNPADFTAPSVRCTNPNPKAFPIPQSELLANPNVGANDPTLCGQAECSSCN